MKNGQYHKVIHSYRGFDLAQEFHNYKRYSYFLIYQDGKQISSMCITSEQSFIRVIDNYLRHEKNEIKIGKKYQQKAEVKVVQMVFTRPAAVYSNKSFL